MAEAHPKPQHDYHLVEPSPWPVLASLSVFVLAIGAIAWMKTASGGVFGLTGPWLFAVGSASVLAVAFFWWRDVIREAQSGHHTPVVQLHLRYGMILFIASEVMFFAAWFWAYYDAAWFPADVSVLPGTNEQTGMVAREALTGGKWPPQPSEGLFHSVFNPWGVPLVNTLILLLSGCTVTFAHHALLENNRRGLVWGLAATIALGVIFTALQAYEYAHAAFSYAGHIYGATFFMATGFHGAHVIIGTVFLAVCFFRALAGHFTPRQHFGFEAAAWYWHFVDVVWLFLFFSIYVLGSDWGRAVTAGAH